MENTSTSEPHPPDEPRMMLREWSVAHAYSSYYVGALPDLEVVAEAIVRAKVARVAYVADGDAFWLKDGALQMQRPKLEKREHELHASITLPEGLDQWAERGLFAALLHRFSEKKVLSPLDGPMHHYLRAFLEPSMLVFEDETLFIVPTLKLHQDGVFTLSYSLDVPDQNVGIAEFVNRYVNLFERWTKEALVPASLAIAGATGTLLREAKGRRERKSNLSTVELMRQVARKASTPVRLGDLEFEMYPAHVDLMAMLLELIEHGHASMPGDRQEATPSPDGNVETSPEASDIGGEAAEEGGDNDEDELDAEEMKDDEVEDGDSSPARQEYILADIYQNTEYAIRSTLDPPREGRAYVWMGARRQRLRIGNYWHGRTNVVIHRFDQQPDTADEILSKFSRDLGSIMSRAPNAPPKIAMRELGESLRPFQDHTLHMNLAVSLCVYVPVDRSNLTIVPWDLAAIERSCTFEAVDYLAMRCHQLDEHAGLARTVNAARGIRTDLGRAENLSRTTFRAGELNDAVRVAWNRMSLDVHAQEVREKAALAAEVAAERSNERAARINLATTLVFGLVGTAGLSDAVTGPIWRKLHLPLPEGLEGPVLFSVSAAVVLLLLSLVSFGLGRRHR